MKKLALSFLILTAVFAELITARADTAIIFADDGTADPSVYDQTVGWAFTVNMDITVTKLGNYDPVGGLADSHPVGIWNSSGQLIVQATIPAGTSAPREGNFRYVDVPNTTLVPGQYVIGALYFANHADLVNGADSAGSLSINPSIASVHSRYAHGATLGLPSNLGGPLAYFGPNFQFTTGNTAPVADDQSVTTDQDMPIDIVLTASDAEGDTLTFQVVTQPAHGTLSGTPPSLTYTPAAGYSGLDSFTFQASDGSLVSAPAQVSITVTPTSGLIGTYTINYRYNAAGCYVDQSNPDYSQANPYYCGAIPPGPIFITAAPGEYQLVIVAGTGFYAWSGDASGGTLYLTGQGPGAVVSIHHAFGQIALYFWDWYAWDNDPNIQTTIMVYRTSAEPPTIACPGNMTTSTAPGQCSQVVDFSVTATGDFPIVVCNPASGSVIPKGTTMVNCIATDARGQTATCSFTVTVNDAELPTITCPANVTVSTDAGQCYATAVALGQPTTADNCGLATVNNDAPAQFAKGLTTVTWTVIDASGNAATCQQPVTVIDTEKPALVCPATIVLPCSVDPLVPVTFIATATDNCDPAPVVTYSIQPGSGFPVGTTTVTVTATDASRNHNSCSFTVTRAPLSFTGFLSPIGGADATGGSFADPLRTFKMKSTIPVKFTASCGGSPVLENIHTLQAVKWSSQTDSDAPIDATPTDAATTGNQFRLAGSEWHFNLDTKATGMSAGKWQLIATLSDGSQHSVWIQLK